MLAIVIPYYKLTFFEETLQSLANQTDKRFKVYIGDDASLENPKLLIEKYKEKFNFNYLRFEINLGKISLVQQWNRCIAMVDKEEWLMILGDDDKLEHNLVAAFYKNYNVFNERSNLIRFSTEVINGESQTLPQNYLLNPVWELSADSFVRRIKKLSRSTLSEYIFLRKSYLKFGFRDYPLAWHSDDMAWLDFADNKPIYSINDAIVSVRISALSISGNNDNLDLKQLASILFYKDLLNEKLPLFKKNIRLELMLSYEMNMKKIRKVDFNEWKFLSILYLINFKTIPLLKLFRRVFLSKFIS